ncbi:MAG: transposase [Halothiobacillus sp.]
MSQRRQYSAEYKHEAVRWVARSDKPVSQLARDLGINPAMASRWCREQNQTGSQTRAMESSPR